MTGHRPALLLLAASALIGCPEAPAQQPTEPGPTPSRVVALAPSLVEIAADIGATSQLVGISSYGQAPQGAEKVARVGGFIDPSIEHIIALRPDLVVGVPLQKTALESCRAAGLRTLEVRCETLSETLAAYRLLGAALAHQEEAETARSRLKAQLDGVRDRAKVGLRPRTLMLLGRAGQDLQQVFPVAPGNFLHELLELAGGQNVLTEAAPSISTESVIVLAPEVIIELAMDEEGTQRDRRLEPSPMWERLPSIPAVREGRVYGLSTASLLQPGPRMGHGAELIYDLLQGSQSSSP